MAKAAISEIKSKLAHYLRLVKAGEEVEILERGVPIAYISAKMSHIEAEDEDQIIPATSPIKLLQTMKFTVRLKDKNFDVVDLLLEDRKKR